MKLLTDLPELPDHASVTLLAPSAEVDRARWAAAQLAAAGPQPRVLSHQVLDTNRGWPCELAIYETCGRVLVLATYEFLDLAAGIAIAGLDRDWLTANESVVIAALRAVEPDWNHGEPLTLLQLWS